MLFHKVWIICRVCLKQREQLYDLFDDTVTKKIWLSLRDCGGVPVRKDDDLPDKICETCLVRLRMAMNFRSDCQRGHRELSQKLMDRNDMMHEDFLKGSDLKGSKSFLPKVICVTSNQTEINENKPAAATINDNKCIENENNDPNTKQYCVVKKYDNEETKTKSQENEPIVLVLRLKDIENNESFSAKIKTERETRIIDKKVAKQISQKTTKRIQEYSKLKYKAMKEQYKSDLKRETILFTCKICKKSFKTQELFRHHTYVHKKPHQCKICNKRFSQKHDFMSHNNGHCGVEPHYCRICYRTFSSISTRNTHERINHKNLEFKCEKCNKVFRFLSFLQRHSQSHRPRKCFICNKEFASLQMVRIHHQRKHLKLL